ncbi:MAG TPA: hypothetical protein VM869_07840, partial [Enhygromyxa sp.]|nr:hypothetical protein [Enhygromyxa sp.]
ASCGDGLINGDEICDGAALNDETCESQGYFAGELACAGDCSAYELASCNNCGNGVIDELEICDGVELGGESCVNLGYLAGNLGCSDACGEYDESNCVDDYWGDDFEAGAELGAEWVLTGANNWFGGTNMPHGGSFTAENGDIGDSQSSHMAVTLNFTAPGTVSFWYRYGTESGWDYLRFFIDDVQQVQWSGVGGWAQYQSVQIPAGQHTLRWSYMKDSSLSSNGDTVWIDDITTTSALLP